MILHLYCKSYSTPARVQGAVLRPRVDIVRAVEGDDAHSMHALVAFLQRDGDACECVVEMVSLRVPRQLLHLGGRQRRVVVGVQQWLVAACDELEERQHVGAECSGRLERDAGDAGGAVGEVLVLSYLGVCGVLGSRCRAFRRVRLRENGTPAGCVTTTSRYWSGVEGRVLPG